MAKQKKSEFIDIQGVLREYMSKWYWFLISLIICIGIGFLVAKKNKPIYEVDANVLISQDDTTSGLMPMGSVGELFGSKAKVDDEVFVISSHSLLRDVANDLGINKMHFVRLGFLNTVMAYPEFPVDVVAAPGVIDTLRTPIYFKIKVDDNGLVSVKAKAHRNVIAEVKDAEFPVSINTDYGNFVVDTTSYYESGKDFKTYVNICGYDAVAEDISELVSTSIGSKRSNVIRLSMKTENVDYGKDILNKILENYNIRGINEKNLQSEKTAKFIEERLAIISDDLSDTETEIQKYKETKGIVDVEAEAIYQTEKRAKLEEALVNVETQAQIIKLTGEFLSDPENAYSLIPMAIDNQGLQEGIMAYNELVLQRMNLVADAKPNNKTRQILDGQIDAMRNNIITSVNKAYDNMMVTVRDLRNEMNTAMGQLGGVPAQEREFLNMKRQQEIKQQLYLFLLQRREETAMMLANAVPKGIIIDEAFALNRPVNLSKMAIVVTSAIIGLLLGFLIIYLQKVLRVKFSTRDELEALISTPILGEISQSRSKEVVVAKPKSNSSTAELFRLVRSNLLFMLGDPSNKVILITSTKSGEGKSFISINISSSLAMLGKKVLLVGLDIRKPRLAEYLNMPANPGFTTYIAGSSQLTIDQIIHKNVFIEGLDMIFAGPVPPNPSELLISHKVDDFFNAMREEYDYIIIDSAPVGMVSDSLALSRVADATVYVCRANYTTKSDIHLLEGLYDDNRLPKLGIVLNGTTAKQGYGYGYGESQN